MGIFDNLKMAQDMMKNMSPDQLKELMAQAGQQQKMLEEMIRKVVAEEIEKRGLVSRDQVREIIKQP